MTVILGDIDPAGTPGAPGDEKATKDATEVLRKRLVALQDRLWAQNTQSLLIVLQAMDAGGKDGTVRKVFSGVNPQGVRVRSFKEPSSEELEHDFLWRVHPHVPARGEIVIFNRSHYEAVLVERVLKLTPKSIWTGRYAAIRAFEHGLAEANTRVVKFMLHISQGEQKRRFDMRLADPEKRWKYDANDLKMTAKWSEFTQAYEDAINETSTPDAPWFVIPADHKWYRNWKVMSVVVETLEAMKPAYPASKQ